MGWKKGSCKGKDVWVEVDPGGSPVVQSGRVPVRYSDKEGAKLYRAGLGNIQIGDGGVLDLPAGTSADAAGKGAKKGGRGASGFGSAGTRTSAQAAAAAQAAGALVESLPKDAAICFTDGGCKGNPGPAGSGAVVRLPDGTRLERSKALGQGTNNIGELTAIGMALEMLDEAEFPLDAPVHVLTDSKYSNGVLTMGWKAKANRELILKVRAAVQRRGAVIHWIAGHAGIPENERADALASQGVSDSMRRR